MRSSHDIKLATLQRILTLLACLLIVKVTVGIVGNYGNYVPPNFETAFLHGRQSYFFGGYHWAFYFHIASGPVALILGMILLSEPFRLKFPKWHRYLGRIQVLTVVFLICPSGLWMSFHAETGAVAGAGFATLAILTGTCTALGWRSAVKRSFSTHRRWMWRSFLLLSSAVVLRLMAGLATVADIEGDWIYPLQAWTSWLVPLLLFELTSLGNRQGERFLPSLELSTREESPN